MMDGNGSSSASREKPQDAADACVETLPGPELMGQDKWLGGASSPCGQFVYGVPGTAKQVLRIEIKTGKVDMIGDPYIGKFKWLRAVEVPADVAGPDHPCGLIFCLPINADSVLRIDPATQEVSTIGGPFTGDWKWHGGNLASDGMIYGIPANATQVIRINPRTSEVTMIGEVFEGRQKWYGGIMAANGSIYGIPHTATGVLKITPGTGECIVIGEGLPAGGWKWHGGEATVDRTIIYGYPNNADTVLKVDTRTDTVTTIGSSNVLKSGRHRDDQKYKYLGGAIASDGNLYCFPCDAERVLRVNTRTDEVSTIGPEFLHSEVGLCVNKWQNGFSGRDGAVYGIPQRARGVVRVKPATNSEDEPEVTVLNCGDEFDAYSDGKDKFEGGVMGSDGCIYCIPLRAKHVLKVIPASPL